MKKLILAFILLYIGLFAQTKVEFYSIDSLRITADLYLTDKSNESPFILLCHQAGWSRGEYIEIAPKLNQLGFNCLAIDQRSGGEVNGVINETFQLANNTGKKTTFIDAEQDIIAAIDYIKTVYNSEKIILWGSSYSAALVLRIAGTKWKDISAVLSFSPGEYFTRFGKPSNWIAESAQHIEVPVFITSAKSEYKNWKNIFDKIKSVDKKYFIPERKGNHGSRALWKKFNDSNEYWKAVKEFLKNIK